MLFSLLQMQFRIVTNHIRYLIITVVSLYHRYTTLSLMLSPLPPLSPLSLTPLSINLLVAPSAGKQLRIDVRSDVGAYVGTLTPEGWELLLPYPMSSTDFSGKKEGRVPSTHPQDTPQYTIIHHKFLCLSTVHHYLLPIKQCKIPPNVLFVLHSSVSFFNPYHLHHPLLTLHSLYLFSPSSPSIPPSLPSLPSSLLQRYEGDWVGSEKPPSPSPSPPYPACPAAEGDVPPPPSIITPLPLPLLLPPPPPVINPLPHYPLVCQPLSFHARTS